MIERVRSLGHDLIISDERSTDGTIAIAEGLGVPVHQRDGSGKGFGVRKALEVAAAQGYDLLVLIDCDLTYPVERIPDLLAEMASADMAVGYRDFSKIHWSHRLVNYLHTGMINVLFGAKLRDINSGLRVLRVSAFHGRIDAQSFDVEAQMTVRALKAKRRIRELPVDYRQRGGRSKIRAWHTWTICQTILAERLG
jgi:dolichol-phosphate mannosyltransferase